MRWVEASDRVLRSRPAGTYRYGLVARARVRGRNLDGGRRRGARRCAAVPMRRGLSGMQPFADALAEVARRSQPDSSWSEKRTCYGPVITMPGVQTFFDAIVNEVNDDKTC